MNTRIADALNAKLRRKVVKENHVTLSLSFDSLSWLLRKKDFTFITLFLLKLTHHLLIVNLMTMPFLIVTWSHDLHLNEKNVMSHDLHFKENARAHDLYFHDNVMSHDLHFITKMWYHMIFNITNMWCDMTFT